MSPFWPGFTDGAYTMRSAAIDNEACINLYPETVDSQSSPKRAVLYGTPGLFSQVTAADAISRGMFSQDGRHFTVIGATLYELTITGSAPAGTLVVQLTSRGTVANNSSLVYFASNGAGGNQLAISSAGSLYMFNLSSNTLSAAISLPLTNAAGPVVFLNSYFLLLEVNSLKVWFSAFEDGTSWDGLDYFTRSNTSDNLVGMVAWHDYVRVFGSKTSEFFYNVGEADNPFLPYPGSITMDGAVGATTIAVIGDSIVWLSRNEHNVVRMLQATFGASKIISTPAVEFALAGYTSVTDSEVLVYEQEGHPFAIWTFPTADVAWAFDLREGKWHQRLGWNNVTCSYYRWRARGCCAPGGGSQAVLVGDYVTGDIHLLSLDRFDDNGTLIRRQRRAPYVSDENQWLFLDQVELGIQSGVGLASGVGVNATLNFHVSRDSGQTYSPNVPASMGLAGATKHRAIWRRLGRARADRLVIDISQTDPVRTVWGPGLWIRATPGSGAL